MEKLDLMDETFLLNILIVLAPVLIYSLLFDGKSIIIRTFLNGGAALLCMFYSFPIFGLYFDLRYIPLYLAFLYGNARSGWMVFIVIIIARTYLNGDMLLIGYLTAVISALIPFLIMKRFAMIADKWKRVRFATGIAVSAGIGQIGIILGILDVKGKITLGEGIIPVMTYQFSLIIAMVFAILLHETILERKRYRQEMIQVAKLQTVSQLAASIAHEVRNPLTVVKGFLQLMQKEKNNQEKESMYQYLSLVLTELNRAESIISDYLNFSKPQLKKLEKVNLKHCMEDTIVLLTPLALKEGVQLSGHLKFPMLQIETDPYQFQQAIINFVKNAIEATPPGGNVTVWIEREEYKVDIIISDDGQGMTKEQLARVGNLFYTTKEKGTGIGTMVSIGIIEAINGKVSYASVVGEGTCVRITLPILL
ncbi:ATP-binding protein [Bacillus solitudinis]|uniref:ATP-binding protein n=1 Tax=Bacillus solitudinis TaxID=2014074 RepID=UPI000C237E0A|nr:ATP-binding protein [Bacillus solitudinis]